MNKQITEIDLNNIGKIMKEMELDYNLIESSQTMPLSSIILKYDTRNKVQIDVSFAFIPIPENTFPNIKILQIYYELPQAVSPEKTQLALELTNTINYLTIIGQYGLKENKITYRYCHAMPLFSNILEQKKSIIDMLKMVVLYIETFELSIKKVLDGSESIAEMVESMQ